MVVVVWTTRRRGERGIRVDSLPPPRPLPPPLRVHLTKGEKGKRRRRRRRRTGSLRLKLPY
jgi:hypothetical protein